VAGKLVRILSDIHYGDRASRVAHLSQLRPLCAGVDRLIFNGDTVDTRPSPRPEHARHCCDEVRAFAHSSDAAVTFLTGNHDPDLSTEHELQLAEGRVLVTHGDVIFDDIVPWGRDAATIRRRIAAELNGESSPQGLTLEQRYAIWRRVAASIPQRHQSERHRLKFAIRFAADTIWPPTRILRILRAWRVSAASAARLAQIHRPAARFIIVGHTHRPGIWSSPNGPVVINTGSLCPPLGGYAVDLTPSAVRVRRVEKRAGHFHPGAVLAEFPLPF
jgi:predicted phosphodiesterase